MILIYTISTVITHPDKSQCLETLASFQVVQLVQEVTSSLLSHRRICFLLLHVPLPLEWAKGAHMAQVPDSNSLSCTVLFAWNCVNTLPEAFYLCTLFQEPSTLIFSCTVPSFH